MILQILQNTPPWVFALFFVLLLVGGLQTRTRELSLARVALMPAIFLPLSLWGVWNAFGPEAFAFGAWLAAAVGAAYGLMSGAFLARAARILGAQS
jgi:hypothetical protein